MRQGDIMKLKSLALFLSLGLCFAYLAHADESIYDVVNNEDMDTFSEMVTLGYDIDEPDPDGFTPLMIAAALGKANFAQYLINNQANVNKRSYYGITALHRAAQAGHSNIVNILVEAGAWVNMPDLSGDTPLMYAVRAERQFTAELLIKLGSDVNFMNAQGETALKIAEKKRFKAIYELLRANGAK